MLIPVIHQDHKDYKKNPHTEVTKVRWGTPYITHYEEVPDKYAYTGYDVETAAGPGRVWSVFEPLGSMGRLGCLNIPYIYTKSGNAVIGLSEYLDLIYPGLMNVGLYFDMPTNICEAPFGTSFTQLGIIFNSKGWGHFSDSNGFVRWLITRSHEFFDNHKSGYLSQSKTYRDLKTMLADWRLKSVTLQ
jgi:hypothetical protein